MRVLTIIVVIGFLTVSSAQAASAEWDGRGTDSTWTTSENWNPNTAPVPAIDFDLFFGGTRRLINTNNFTAGSNFRNITFNNKAGAFVLSGNAITLNGSITNNESTTAQTINLDMALSAGMHNVNAAAGGITLGGALSGASGGVTKTGVNTLILTGTNTYGGATVVSAGTLQVGAGGATGTLGTGNVTNNAALVFNRNNAMTVSNLISGSGSLTQSGSGTTILTGANTYTNTTTVSAGTLQIGAGGTVGMLGSGNVVNNSALVFNRSDAMMVGNLISGSGSLTQLGSGTLTLTGTNTYSGATTVSGGTLQIGNGGIGGTMGTGNVTNNAILAFNRNNAVTVGNVISGSGSVTKLGTNTLTLTAANTYSGETTIRGGALVASNTLALQNSTLNYTNNSGAMIFGRGATAYTLGGLAGDKNLALTNMSGTAVALTVGNNAADTTYSGALSADGRLIKTGAGTLTLTGTNTYSGATTISAGTLRIGNGGTLGTGNVTNNAALVFNRSDAVTVGNVISGSGVLAQSGAGTLTLTASNTYIGGTTINGGVLSASRDANLGAAAGTLTFANGGALQLQNTGIVYMTRAVTLNSGGGVLYVNDPLYWSGNITGGGGLTHNGEDDLILHRATGSNNIGAITVNGGRLFVQNTLGNINNSSISVSSGAILDFEIAGALAPTNKMTFASGAGLSTRLGTLTIDTANVTLPSAGTMIFNSDDLNTTNIIVKGNYPTLTGDLAIQVGSAYPGTPGAVTLTGPISGDYSLDKTASGTLILSGTNTFSGLTTISEGTLVAANALALQNSTLDYNTGDGTLAFGGGSAAYTLGGLSGDKNIALTNAGGTAIALTVGNNSDDTTYSGALSAGGSLIKTGEGILTLTGTNTYSGATTISAGTLQVGNGGTSGTLGAGSVTNNGTLAFNRSDAVTVGNVISGSGSLIKSGTNTLTLTAASTYTNTTFVSSGRLIVNGSLQSEMIEVSSGAILSGTGTVQAVTLDPGAFLTAAGEGQGTLNFTGEMILSGGSTNFMQILSDSLYDVIKGTGDNTLTTAGAFVFDFTGNTTVAEGSTYTVLQNWNSIDISGATFTTKGLDPALSLDTSRLASDGVIQVIPEPAVVSLIGLGGLLTLLSSRLRRRRV